MYDLSEDKLFKPFDNNIDKPNILAFLRRVLRPDMSFLLTCIIYGLIISLLSLATPISVQFLINSVAFMAMVQPIIIIGTLLFILLSFSAILHAIQFYVTEIFQRRFFARMAAEVGNSLLKAQYKTFEQANQSEMVNRFFETVTIQKSVPQFLTKTFSLILQTIAGLILVSFYHPLFLLFSILVVGFLYLVWKLHYRKALVSAFYESRRKYDIVGWLEDIACGHVAFKSTIGVNYARYKIDFLTKCYLKERKKHFYSLFSQVILLLIFYVIASVSLLMFGAMLVLKGQLTIGQLVAAELVLSALFYRISQAGRDLEGFYDLVAACEKLSQFQNIPSEEAEGALLQNDAIAINFDDVTYKNANRQYHFNLKFAANKNYIIATGGFSTKKALIDLLCGFANPAHGLVEINGTDIRSLNRYDLRSKIAIIDNAQLLEGTIEEYLTFFDKSVAQSDVNWALKVTGLDRLILKSKDGLDTRIIPSGWPLSESEKILLKIARILIQKPKLIIITEVLDMLVLGARQRILHYLTKESLATVIYFSHRVDGVMDFDNYIFVDKAKHYEFSSIQELDNFEKEHYGTKNK